MIYFLIVLTPFEDTVANYKEIVNEITTLLLIYNMTGFTGQITTAETRYYIGWPFIIIVSIHMSLHLIIVILTALKGCCETLKLRCKRKHSAKKHPGKS